MVQIEAHVSLKDTMQLFKFRLLHSVFRKTHVSFKTTHVSFVSPLRNPLLGAENTFPGTKKLVFSVLKFELGDINPEEHVFYHGFPDLNYEFVPLAGELVAAAGAHILYIENGADLTGYLTRFTGNYTQKELLNPKGDLISSGSIQRELPKGALCSQGAITGAIG